MKVIHHFVFIIYFLICSVVLPFKLSANTKKTINRKIDHIIVKGDLCGKILGKQILKYGLFVLNKGKFEPIPFQIDEINEDGEYVLTEGEEKSLDEDKGLFDNNDELVFMVMDSGDKVTDKNIFPESSEACLELTINDPVNSKKAWVYLMTFPGSPERSAVDYVNCNPEKYEFRALNYVAAFDRGHPVTPSGYSFTKRIGGDEKDFLDRVKARVLIEKFITLEKTEEDITVDWLGYIDGPVRVVYHTENTVPLFLGIPASTTEQTAFFYFNQGDFALTLGFPIKLSRFRINVIDDFSGFKGWTYYSDRNPKGHVIDGVMDETDKQLDLSPFKWGVISNGKLSFWSRCLAPPFCPVTPNLYFNDDINAKDEYEDVQGELPALGFDFRENWEKFDEDTVEFRLIHFFTKGYKRGNENEIVDVHDRPLEVSARYIDGVLLRRLK